MNERDRMTELRRQAVYGKLENNQKPGMFNKEEPAKVIAMLLSGIALLIFGCMLILFGLGVASTLFML